MKKREGEEWKWNGEWRYVYLNFGAFYCGNLCVGKTCGRAS